MSKNNLKNKKTKKTIYKKYLRSIIVFPAIIYSHIKWQIKSWYIFTLNFEPLCLDCIWSSWRANSQRRDMENTCALGSIGTITLVSKLAVVDQAWGLPLGQWAIRTGKSWKGPNVETLVGKYEYLCMINTWHSQTEWCRQTWKAWKKKKKTYYLSFFPYPIPLCN